MPTFTVTIPYNAALSENNRLNWSPRNGRMFANQDYKRAQEVLITAIKMAAKGCKFLLKTKVWIDMDVYRPTAGSDPSNLIKGVNDSVARALDLNDSWFGGSYRGYVDKVNPRLRISVTQ